MTTFWDICFTLLKIIGLAPIVRLKNPSEKVFCKTFVHNIIYNIIFLSAYILVHLYLMIYGDLFKVKENNINYLMSDYFIVTSFFITSLTVAIFTVERRTATEVCNELYAINRLLWSFDKGIRQEEKIDTKMKAMIILNMFGCCGFALYYLLIEQLDLRTLFVLIDDAMITWIVVQYVWTVSFMNSIILAINKQFRSLSNSSVKNYESCFNDTYQVNDDKIDNVASSRLTKLETLQEVWLMFVDATTKFVGFYGLIMLGCVFKFFFSILCDLYHVIDLALVEKRFIITNVYNAFEVIYLSWDVLLLLAVTSFVTNLTREVNNIFNFCRI